MVGFWWMKWMDVGCGSLHVRYIGFDLSHDTAALVFCGVLHFLCSSVFSGTTLHIVGWQA